MSAEVIPPFRIRFATADDVVAIAEVLRNSFAEYESLYTVEGFAATVLTPSQIHVRLNEGPFWVALEKSNVVGTVAAKSLGDLLYIRGMAVDRFARGKGIGNKLLECAEEYALQNGFKGLFLSTTPFLTRAIQLYESHGFIRSGDGPFDLFGTPLFSMFKSLEDFESSGRKMSDG